MLEHSTALSASATLSASLGRPRLDATVVFGDALRGGGEEELQSKWEPRRPTPIFAFVSVNPLMAPSAEVPWSQLLALSLALEGEPVLTVGRGEECGIRLTDPRVSFRHFGIYARRKDMAYECFISDFSSNGTIVNGESVGKGNRRQLHSGDEICILPAHVVGDSERISFLFRNATESFAVPDAVRALALDDLLACPICMQTMYKCVTLAPCAHNFCMSCCSDWMRRKSECPVCRRGFIAIMKNHAMDSVIEVFLDSSPKHRRSEQDLNDMDARDHLRLGSSGKLVLDGGVLQSQRPASRQQARRSASPPAADGAVADRLPEPVPEAPDEGGGRAGSQICVVQ